MKIIRAAELGLCFGVRDALHIARIAEHPTQITVHGQLAHNPLIQQELSARGIALQSETLRTIPNTPRVLITAHGISNADRRTLLAAGKHLIDATCPLVGRAHAAAQALAARGRFVVIIGQPGHVEVQGLTGDLPPTQFAVFPSGEHVYPIGAPHLGVMCQTTTTPGQAAAVLRALRAANPTATIEFIDTICAPTKDRQRAMEILLDQVQAVVVIGGKNSNNTRQLVDLARHRGTPAFHVEGPGEICASALLAYHTIGLTAGTSTLPQTIDAVEEELQTLAAQNSVVSAAGTHHANAPNNAATVPR